jgi:hypothetical protein
MAKKPKEKTTKEIAARIDPIYFRSWHRLRKARFFLSLGLVAIVALWVAGAAVMRDETLYANGPVAASHTLFEADCQQCHVASFSAVEDATCQLCHPAAAHSEDDPSCAHCHTEHRGRIDLSVVADAFCNACHKDHSAITDFEGHIGFRIDKRDQHIRFNHAAHLKPGMKNGPMKCASCHVPDGATFLPIAFEAHCSKCHEERVDATLDDVVPHGVQPDRLKDWIAAVYLRGLGVVKPETELPGKGGAPPEWRDVLLRKTQTALGALMKPGAGCMLCHVGQPGRIDPPQIPNRWLTAARFDHHTHRFESCAKCHSDVARSVDAETLSLPKVRNCQSCHKDGGAAHTCITCHAFHR